MIVFKTVVFHVTNILQGEILNVGLAMVCPATNWRAIRFAPPEEIAKLEIVLFGKAGLASDSQYLSGWVNTLLSHESPLDPQDPFLAVFGNPHYMSCFQWRSGPCGILGGRTAERVFESLCADYIKRKGQP